MATRKLSRPPAKKDDKLVSGHSQAYYKKVIQKLAYHGLTQAEIADTLGDGDSPLTLHYLFEKFPALHEVMLEAWDEGQKARLNRVEDALYKRAIGMTVVEEKAVTDKNTGEVLIIELKKEIAPDTNAAIHILSTQKPDKWSIKNIVHHEGQVSNDLIIKYQIPDNKRLG
jgi:hypothetical protein